MRIRLRCQWWCNRGFAPGNFETTWLSDHSSQVFREAGAAAPSSAGRLSNIDALRGSAALAVAISHIYQQFYAEQFGPVLHKMLPYAGGWGVTLFFVLSGFCIHLPHAERKCSAAKVGGVAKLNITDFAIQRFFANIPPYWISLGLSLALGAIATTNILNGSIYWADVLVHTSGIHGFFPNCLMSINSVFWTIGLEIYFYIVYIFFANRYLTYTWRRTDGGGQSSTAHLPSRCSPTIRGVCLARICSSRCFGSGTSARGSPKST